ncbi:uncharacterized protein LOC111366672 [Olea europaea var. sylvestris]|uniref:uncharacterized protein LOC111366672 n=1 Tax=Olea europaea var. sylvestris TaxID=158386 RepID=UPI000C1D60AA|nr:uncharacterized protein LOC111366672 [Olea europaea var. sylvestris]
MWSTDRVVQKRSPGVYEVDTYSALSAKIDSLFHKVDSISQTATAKQVKKPSSEECGANHNTVNCPILAQGVEHADFVQWGQRQQNNPHSKTFNQGWRKHPNFSWSNQNKNRPQGQYQQQDKKPPLEEMFEKFVVTTNQQMEANNQFMRKTDATFQNQSAAIKNLETQMGQMAISITGRTPGNLPSNTEINPKEHAKAITTRSGIQLPEIHVKRSVVSKESTPTADDEIVEQTGQTTGNVGKENSNTSRDAIPINPHEPPIPFPQRLKKHKLDQQYSKFLEVFKKFHINIPFAETLVQMPSYAKFLKDILYNKRKIEEHETVMLTEECRNSAWEKLRPQWLHYS